MDHVLGGERCGDGATGDGRVGDLGCATRLLGLGDGTTGRTGELCGVTGDGHVGDLGAAAGLAGLGEGTAGTFGERSGATGDGCLGDFGAATGLVGLGMGWLGLTCGDGAVGAAGDKPLAVGLGPYVCRFRRWKNSSPALCVRVVCAGALIVDKVCSRRCKLWVPISSTGIFNSWPLASALGTGRVGTCGGTITVQLGTHQHPYW